MNQNTTSDKSVLERHLQTGIQIIIIGILLWFGTKTIATSDAVIRLEEQVLAIRATLSQATPHPITGSDVHALEQVIDYRFQSIERRLANIEDGG